MVKGSSVVGVDMMRLGLRNGLLGINRFEVMIMNE